MEAGRGQGDDDDVRALADFQRAEAILHPAARVAPPRVAISSTAGAGAAVGSPLACLASMAAESISSNMSRSLLLAAPSVPRPSRIPSASMAFTGRRSGRELHVALRAVGDADVGRLQDRAVALREPHAVRAQDALAQEAQVAQVLGRGLPVALLDRLHLVADLERWMRMGAW
jgi:hypothetical protein